MNQLFISSFGVNFEHYDLLDQFRQACPEIPMGVELGTVWSIPNFDQLLDSQQERFRDVPVTLHAPFVEISGAPDSQERKHMDEAFSKAFRWYHMFHARSMVMHTHERPVPANQRQQLQAWSLEAILHMAQRARDEKAHLLVENVGFPAKNSVLLDQDEYVALFDKLPDEVGALIDTGHAMANHWDIPLLIRQLGTRIRGYHLHNTDGYHDLHRPMFEEGLWYTPEQMENLLRQIGRETPDAELIFEYVQGPHMTTELFRADAQRTVDCLNG